MNFKLPELGEGVYEAEVVSWLVKPGDQVRPGQPLLQMLTDKATMEVPAPFEGTIRKLAVEPGQAVKIGQTVLDYETSAGHEQEPASEEKKPAAPAARGLALANGLAPTPTHVQAAPSVRLLARKLGLDLAKIKGTGPHGRILVEDLALDARRAEPRKGPGSPPPLQPGARLKFQGLRRKIAETMVQSKTTIPHYTYVEECDVTRLVDLREELKEPLAARGIKITFLAFFVKAVVAALKEVPMVNASLDEAAGEIVLHDQYHIGIAVATATGLVVPVVRHADRLSLLDLAKEIERLSEDARAGKSKLEDLKGGTFTVTSIGNLGGLFATPVILPPQVGILGIGKIVKRPVFDEQERVRAARMVYLSMSFDHRVLDGAVGTQFGNALVRQLQSPATMIV